MFGERWAGAREALLKQERVLVHEAQRDEFGEASGFGLNLAEEFQLAHPVSGSFHVSIHKRRGGTNAALVCGADDFLPLHRR